VAALLAACSSDPSVRTVGGVSRSVFSEDEFGVSTSPRFTGENIPKGGGTFKLGAPYKVADRWYVPRENPYYDETGVASWYGADFHGRRTANGEVFDANALTAAHPTLPLPCYAEVTNLDNGKSVLVRVNDRGPYVNDRLIDMSYAAAKALGYTSQGRARVRVRYAGRAPLNGDDTRERQYLAARQNPRNGTPPVEMASAAAPSHQSYGNARLPAEASDRWSPTAYRAALAGKAEPPLPTPAARSRDYIQSASANDRRDRFANQVASNQSFDNQPFANAPASGRMSLTAPPAERVSWTPPATQTDAYVPRPFQRASENASQDPENYAPEPAAPPAAVATGRSFVQVGIFRDRSNAERLRHDLASLGPVEVSPLQVGNGEVYRVRIGPFSGRDAERAQSRIATYGIADSALVTD